MTLSFLTKISGAVFNNVYYYYYVCESNIQKSSVGTHDILQIYCIKTIKLTIVLFGGAGSGAYMSVIIATSTFHNNS